MSRIGAEELAAAVVAVWFLATGVVGLFARSAPGRRTLEPTALRVGRKIRASLFVLGALAVGGDAIIHVLDLGIAFPGRIVGLGLAALSVWGALEALRPPIRWARLLLLSVGFVLAVAYAGFRA